MNRARGGFPPDLIQTKSCLSECINQEFVTLSFPFKFFTKFFVFPSFIAHSFLLQLLSFRFLSLSRFHRKKAIKICFSHFKGFLMVPGLFFVLLTVDNSGGNSFGALKVGKKKSKTKRIPSGLCSHSVLFSSPLSSRFPQVLTQAAAR